MVVCRSASPPFIFKPQAVEHYMTEMSLNYADVQNRLKYAKKLVSKLRALSWRHYDRVQKDSKPLNTTLMSKAGQSTIQTGLNPPRFRNRLQNSTKNWFQLQIPTLPMRPSPKSPQTVRYHSDVQNDVKLAKKIYSLQSTGPITLICWNGQ